MWIPDYLHIKNLMTHSDSKIDFVTGRTVMIKGVNNYDHEPKSNGAGKSALMEGISIAYTGEYIRKVDTPNIIKDGELSAYIEHGLHNTMTNQVMVIKREIFRQKNKSSTLIILLNGEPVLFAKIIDGNAKILEFLGISKVDLYNYFIISKKKYTSFFYSSDGDKRKLISRFSNADIVDGVYFEIDKDVAAVKQEITDMITTKNSVSGKISAYQEQIDSDNSEESRKELIKTLEESIEAKEESIISSQTKIATNNATLVDIKSKLKSKENDIKVAEEELAKMKPIDYSATKSTLNKKVKEASSGYEELNKTTIETEELRSEFEESINTLSKEISDIDKKLVNAVECPECHYEFSFKDKTINIAKLNEERTTKLSEVEELQVNINDCNEVLEGVKSSIKLIDDNVLDLNKKIRNLDIEETKSSGLINTKKQQISAMVTLKDKLVSDMARVQASNDAEEERIELLNSSIDTVRKEIKDVKERKSSDVKAELLNKISTCNQEIIDIDKLIQLKETEFSKKSKWTELYKRFNIKLSNMAIKSIEGLSNDIQKKMGSNLSLAIDGYKVNRDGSLSDNITANVLRYGVLEGTFFRNSEGEQSRINVSTTCAMQQLINMNCHTGGLDMMFIDEITESLDSAGIANVVKSLDMIGRTIVIITHASDEAVIVPNEITVTKTAAGSELS